MKRIVFLARSSRVTSRRPIGSPRPSRRCARRCAGRARRRGDAATPQLVAHVRATGATAFTEIELVRRDDAHWVAVVPATDVVVPGLEYYIDAGGRAGVRVARVCRTRSRCASTTRTSARLATRAQRRAALAHPHDGGVGRLRHAHRQRHARRRPLLPRRRRLRVSAVGVSARRDPRRLHAPARRHRDHGVSDADAVHREAGFKVGGWFELGLAPVEGSGSTRAMMVMATPNGFGVGGARRAPARRSRWRVTSRSASKRSRTSARTASSGSAGARCRSSRCRRPSRSSDLPATDRPTGVRLYYDVAHEVGGGVRLGVRVGYAARVQQVAGITGGVGANVDF